MHNTLAHSRLFSLLIAFGYDIMCAWIRKRCLFPFVEDVMVVICFECTNKIQISFFNLILMVWIFSQPCACRRGVFFRAVLANAAQSSAGAWRHELSVPGWWITLGGCCVDGWMVGRTRLLHTLRLVAIATSLRVCSSLWMLLVVRFFKI